VAVYCVVTDKRADLVEAATLVDRFERLGSGELKFDT
jgi:hypothetical protein